MSGWGGTTTLRVLAMARGGAGFCHNVTVQVTAAATTNLLQPSLMSLSELLRQRVLPILFGVLLTSSMILFPHHAQAITAPELRGQFALQDISNDMHGRDLKEKEFLKADLRGIDLSESDLRGAVINTSQLQGANLHGADLEDVVAFSSQFDNTDLSDANFTNAMLMQSRFVNAQIEGTDFTNAVIDLTQMKALCSHASGINSRSGVSTRESLGCR